MRATFRLAMAVAALSLASCHARPRTWSAPAAELRGAEARPWGGGGTADIAELDLTRGAPEEAGQSFLGASLGPSYHELVTVLRGLAKDDQARGVLVRFGSAKIGWARAQEIADLLAAAKSPRRRVVCHAEGYGNATMWIAAR